MILPPTLSHRANDGAHHSPPAVAIILAVVVAILMCLSPCILGKRGYGRFFSRRPRPVLQPESTMCLTPDALNLMPTVRYREKEDTHTPKQVTSLSCCSICTEDFQGGVEVRSLPCRHIFHPSCVDPWLLERSLFCPLCRANVAAGIISVTETEVPARPRRVLFLTQHWRRSRRGPITSTQELLPLANVSTIQSDGPGTAVPPRRYQPSLPTISDVLEEVGPAYR
ncbi:hypothetical protein FOCG_17337 [Fusarium oxysporum f. sp. radicis-lycopersici 26381]|nr:hypothetical protein FOCG_17337 [Fusarium oxysporum f. sp. radicis-lycopersici 26381]